MIIIVEEKVRATAMYIEVNVEKPSDEEIKYPMMEVKTICPPPVTTEIYPTSFTILGERFIPTRKSRKDIPNSEKTFIIPVSLMISSTNGPERTPEIMYPIINGCFNSRIKKETARTTSISRLNCAMTSGIVLL
jgi:hypothetical protein